MNCQKPIDYDLATHCDIENISVFPSEKEVLFLPFSPFEVLDIGKEKFLDEEIYLDKKYVTYIENYQELEKIEKEKLIKENEENKKKEENGEEKEKEKEKEEEKEKEKEKKEKKNILKIENVSNFEFRKQIIQSGLIDEEDIGDIDNLLGSYKKYKKLLNKYRRKIKSKKSVITGEINIFDDIFLNRW